MATILLVDDVELFLQLERSFLEGDGHTVVTAASGEEALSRMEEVKPELLLLDLYMPGIDGDEVCRRLRASKRWRKLPVIMVTAAGKDGEIRKCLTAGCDDYITKPVNKKELIEKVGRLLGKVRMIGVPPLKWSTNWGRFAPSIGGPGDGWEAREARGYRHEAASG